MSSEAVIFIPGIKGTKLTNTNLVNFDTIWSGLQSNFETIQDLELTSARDGKYYDENIRTIIRPGEIEELAYAEFLHDLKTDKPIFIFNYDWRLSAKQNGNLFRIFVDYLIEKSKASDSSFGPFSTFDVITHSLGNFILRNYIKRQGFSKIHKIVFTVPPFKGSIDIASGILIGEGWFPNVKAKIRKLIRTFPGALELLPTYDKAGCFDSGDQVYDFFNFDHWQANIISSQNRISSKFKEALSEARDTVQNELCDLSELSEDEKKRILVICRTGYEGFQSIRIFKSSPGEPDNYFDFAHACRTNDSDGRVPHVSSCCYCDSVLTLVIQDALLYREYSHGFVLKDERVQKLVNRFLFGDTAFNYQIPGASVKKVHRLKPHTDRRLHLPYWTIE